MKKKDYEYFNEAEVKSMDLRKSISFIKGRMQVLQLELEYIKQKITD